MSDTSEMVAGIAIPSGLSGKDITDEEYREYDFSGRTYRIENPQTLFYRIGGTTHRIVDSDGVAHCVPRPDEKGCVLRWKSRGGEHPCQF